MTNAAQSKDEKTWFRYMPISLGVKSSGAYVKNVGFAVIPPNIAYSPYNDVHPPGYRDPWTPGRVFPSYAFVYITRGAGEFDSKPSGTLPIRAGDLFVLFPHILNRYRPLREVGWDEYWLEFDGDHIRHLMLRGEFSPERPVHHIGLHDDILDLFLKSIEVLRNEPPEYELILGTFATQAIARLLSVLKQKNQEGRAIPEIIREAKRWLICEPARENLDHLALRLNMSYMSFRRLFKAETGFSPRQFALEARLRKAADLLDRTDMPVHQIAEQCGMESVYYFSRLFKKKTGLTPSAYRRLHAKSPLR
ncbi:MAG TPA: AraC family transcriptional regulator [Candidatus Sulfotelmatobacter sp.]|nr:AraC family transcriptional regulator [Candidatus Sulfotelmatobacter sp.]